MCREFYVAVALSPPGGGGQERHRGAWRDGGRGFCPVSFWHRACISTP